MGKNVARGAITNIPIVGISDSVVFGLIATLS
jgi:hypothetical protein